MFHKKENLESSGDIMQALARGIDDILNGEDCPMEKKTAGFFLAVYNLNDTGAGKFNYISNSQRKDAKVLLRELLAQLDGQPYQEGSA